MGLRLHEFHQSRGAQFDLVAGIEVVRDYGDPEREHAALCKTAGVLDLSFRSRLCLTGADRQRFLNGQVSNDVNRLEVGEGCYAALITAKGKMISDLNIYRLDNELLLDFEPGLWQGVRERLEHYIIADDVQIVEVANEYGLLSVQGPQAGAILSGLKLGVESPAQSMRLVSGRHADYGEFYVANSPRLGTVGFDLYVPSPAQEQLAQALAGLAERVDGCLCGWQALETARIEAGIPRFGADMDGSTLPPEAGIEDRAVSYTKGCYIGQEVIARIRTYGQVARKLRGLRLAPEAMALPERGDKLFRAGQEVGFITSAVRSPALGANIGLGYVRRESYAPGTELAVRTRQGESPAWVTDLPFPQNFT